MGTPLHYKVQDGCWNCGHVFQRNDFDEDTKFFCCQDGKSRSLSNSHLMGEDFSTVLKNRKIDIYSSEGGVELEKLINDWNTWSEEHVVDAPGTCFCWKNKDPVADLV